MANLQQTLNALQPYVIGIRYIDNGVAVVDAVFKDGWALPESDIIKRVKGNEEVNYHMIFSEKEGVGIDELLEYVAATIKANIERENKHELLKEMVNELKIVFKKNPLVKLKRLKFTFGDEDITPEINEFDLDIDEPIQELPIVEEPIVAIEELPQPISEIQSDVPLTEEDLEILEEERRAANFFKMKEAEALNGTVKKISSTVELPPKRTIQQTIDTDEFSECECGPEEACNKCIGSKDF